MNRPIATCSGDVASARVVLGASLTTATIAAAHLRCLIRGYGGIEGADRLVVLLAEPVVGQVQVDSGRFDVAMPGLGLHRFEGHARLPQSGQAGVPQHVAGQVLDTGTAPGSADDLVNAGRGQRFPAVRSLQDHEHSVRVGVDGAFGVEVVGQCGEEPGRDRDDAVVSALAFGDPHPPVGELDVAQAQAQDLTAP